MDLFISTGLTQLARIGDLHPVPMIQKVLPTLQQLAQIDDALVQDSKRIFLKFWYQYLCLMIEF